MATAMVMGLNMVNPMVTAMVMAMVTAMVMAMVTDIRKRIAVMVLIIFVQNGLKNQLIHHTNTLRMMNNPVR